MLPRELARRMAAHRERQESEVEMLWRHVTLPTLNHLRALINKPMAEGQKPGKNKMLKPSDVGFEDGPEAKGGPKSREEYEADMAYFRHLREHGTRTVMG